MAAHRQLIEEAGLERPVGRLLVVDYVRPQDSRPEGVVFIFDGGVLDEGEVAGMSFVEGEIRSAGFYSMPEVRARVRRCWPTGFRPRWKSATRA
jgi:hypothetical protein